MAEDNKTNWCCKDPHLALAIVILFATGIICFAFKGFFTKHEIVVSVIGGICSFVGFILTFIQISKLSTATDAAKTAVNTNIEKVNKYLSFSDVSKYTSICDQILNAIETKQFGEAKIYLLKIQESLIEIQSNDRLSQLYKEEELTQLLQCITPDIKNIQDSLISGAQLDYSILTLHVVKAKEFLLKISGKLKYSEL